ncbi:MAG: hypothetical protein JXB05_15925 [Myxococcaceae bacterium]|nr:hypothetical protein [Myxococcaceae bacterium]
MSPVTPPVKPTSTDTAPAQPLAKPSLIARFKALVLEYGPLVIVINYLLFFLTLGGFFMAFKLGFKPESAGATTGTWAAAYAASQAVKPIRFAIVLAVTPWVGRIPFIARLLKRL